jgi:hypothetical protein
VTSSITNQEKSYPPDMSRVIGDMQIFSIRHWQSICDLTLTLKQARKIVVPPGSPFITSHETLIFGHEHQYKKTFQLFMSLLNRAVYGATYRRYNKRLRVISVLEKKNDRWHFHAAIEPPPHLSNNDFKTMILENWSNTDWGYNDNLVRFGADPNWIDFYTLKISQKDELENWYDCIDWKSFHNPGC